MGPLHNDCIDSGSAYAILLSKPARRSTDESRLFGNRWPRRHRLEAQGLRFPFRPLARLAQNEKRKCTGSEARSRGGLGEMTRRIRRKSEVVRFMNERNFPHLVELVLPPEGFRSVLLEIDEAHRERQIPVRRGRNRYEAKSFYIRLCFPDAATADAFRNRFGGESLTAPEKSARVI